MSKTQLVILVLIVVVGAGLWANMTNKTNQTDQLPTQQERTVQLFIMTLMRIQTSRVT
jgi:Tfp pilus assembly protein PilO